MTPFASRASRLLAAALVAATVGAAFPRAQEASLEQRLTVMQAYLRVTYARLANIVVSEVYEQNSNIALSQTRRLESEVLLVRHPVNPENWLVFRDVLSVNRRPVANHEQRLTDLFINPTAASVELATQIVAASDQYQLPGASFALTNPYVVVGLMDRFYQPRFEFRLGEVDDKVARGARIIRFRERQGTASGGPVISSGDPKDVVKTDWLFKDEPANGSVWIDPSSGRILKTALNIGRNATTTTTFRLDEALNVIVPVEMTTRWALRAPQVVNGKAKYGQVRRFGVDTEETLKLPTAPPANKKSR
jgi:hypothetical protein